MGNDPTVELQHLIDRANQGDDGARWQLIQLAYGRLRHLSASILRRSFPRLMTAPGLVDTTDVANEIACRLYCALEDVKPATVRDLFRLAAQRIRWLLLDLAKQADRAGPPGCGGGQPVESYHNAARSDPPLCLAELYEQIEGLPTLEREVVDLLYFHGLSQAETADHLGVTERTVRRHWTTARARLFQALAQNPPSPRRADHDRAASS
jgi:DNA-directed RNA polymerase specialized sigma24 family protein